MYASPRVIILATVFLSSNEKLDGSSFSVLGRNSVFREIDFTIYHMRYKCLYDIFTYLMRREALGSQIIHW